jgi:LysM repeat protein
MTRHAYGTAISLLLLSLIVPPVWGQQYFLYSPKPVTPEETKQPRDNSILVREVAVQKGDTLYRISHRFSGRGWYYPQILLFNDIKNPNLIHAGDTLKVPVTKGRSVDEEAAAPKHRKKAVGRKQKAARKQQTVSAAPALKQPVETKPSTGQLSELSLSELKPAKKKRSAAQSRTSDVRKTSGREQRKEVSSASGKPVAADEAKTRAIPRQQGERPANGTSAAAQRLFEQAIKAYRQDDCRAALDLFDHFLVTYPTLPQAADASLYKAECYMKLSR